MLMFPVATMIRFCHNHGLIQVSQRPQWYTVYGGAKHYVEKIIAAVDDARLNTPVLNIERTDHGVSVNTAQSREQFDHVILATHTNTSLHLLALPTEQEQRLLGAIRYQPNRAVLHTDVSVMPRKKRAWAAWNYERAAQADSEAASVCLHYWLNLLQPLPFSQDVFVSLNPLKPIDPTLVLGEFSYDHPVFDLSAIQAQARMSLLQGQQRTWFAGAWMGYGFHEDGFQSGRAAAQGVLSA
jgi:predicted NAD/FAD-binding protein